MNWAPSGQLFLPCKHFHRLGFLGMWKIILGVRPWNKCWATVCYRLLRTVNTAGPEAAQYAR